jgi:hypothetical protein
MVLTNNKSSKELNSKEAEKYNTIHHMPISKMKCFLILIKEKIQ